MDALDHPLKKGVEQIRKLIKSVHNDIEEQIKWNAPSYSYHGNYLVTFNLRAKHHIHLVFHNPKIAQVKSKILEGDYNDRRMAYFTSLDEIKTNAPALTKAIIDLIRLQGH
jgi:uncharacterized protein YdhG (YjbR/CyaY superfamily)